MTKIKIIIADDHSIVRSGLKLLFKSSPEFSVIGEASNGESVLSLVAKRKPDVIIMDISMPGMNGIESTRIIRQRFSGVKVLILTIYDSEEYVYQMVRAGANGYVLKDAGKKELFAAVRAVASGERFFSPGVSRMMIEEFVKRAQGQLHEERPDAQSRLTKRESEILRYIADGLSNPEIAKKLFLSVRTVDTHRTNMMHKLDIHDTAGLVRYAIEKGIVALTEKS